MSKELNILQDLFSEIGSIQKAMIHLERSYNSCSKIGLKNEYSEEELEKWEAFTARYSRLSDITTQKVMNSFLLIETGNTGSLLDKANFAEKKSWVETAEEFRRLRLLRNYIAHEYEKQNTNEVFEMVYQNYHSLHLFVTNVLAYYNSNSIYKV